MPNKNIDIIKKAIKKEYDLPNLKYVDQGDSFVVVKGDSISDVEMAHKALKGKFKIIKTYDDWFTVSTNKNLTEEDFSTSAPTSIATGQFPSRLGNVQRRNTMTDKIKSYLKDY
jgi:hypothetical protein